MQEIATEAGLSVGAIYRYFRSKDDLIRSVIDQTIVSQQGIFAQAFRAADSPLDILVAR